MDFFLSPDRFTLRCRSETRGRNWREKVSYPAPGSGLSNGPSFGKISVISQEIFATLEEQISAARDLRAAAFFRCVLNQFPDVAQVAFGSEDVAETDADRAAFAQLGLGHVSAAGRIGAPGGRALPVGHDSLRRFTRRHRCADALNLRGLLFELRRESL